MSLGVGAMAIYALVRRQGALGVGRCLGICASGSECRFGMRVGKPPLPCLSSVWLLGSVLNAQARGGMVRISRHWSLVYRRQTWTVLLGCASTPTPRNKPMLVHGSFVVVKDAAIHGGISSKGLRNPGSESSPSWVENSFPLALPWQQQTKLVLTSKVSS